MDSFFDFFMSIDGVLYYVMVVINVFLIFVIIGYLADREEKQLLKYEKATAPIPTAPPVPSTPTARAEYSTPIPTVKKTEATSPIVNNQVPLGISQNNNLSSDNTSTSNEQKAPAVLIINGNSKGQDMN